MPLQDLITATLRQGASLPSRPALQSALPWLLQPWATVWAAAFPEAARPTAPYALQQLLLVLLPDLDDTQRRALLPVIRQHATDRSLAQWLTALCLPRHPHHGLLRLRPLGAEALAAHASAALAVPPPVVSGSGLVALGTSLAALGSLAVLGTVSPVDTPWTALACSAGSALAFVGPPALALRSAADAYMMDVDHPLNGVPWVLVRQVDTLLDVLLPAWGPRNHRALTALWCEAPGNRSLLDVVCDAAALQGAKESIPRVLAALSERYAAGPRPTARPPSLTEALTQMLLALMGPTGTAPPAGRPRPAMRIPQALDPIVPSSIPAGMALQNVASLHQYQSFQKNRVQHWERQHPEGMVGIPPLRDPAHRRPGQADPDAAPQPPMPTEHSDEVRQASAGAAASPANSRWGMPLLSTSTLVGAAHGAAQALLPGNAGGAAAPGLAPADYRRVAVGGGLSLLALAAYAWSRGVPDGASDDAAAHGGALSAGRYTPPDLQSLQTAEATIVGLPDGSWTSAWDVQHPQVDRAAGPLRPRRSVDDREAQGVDENVSSRHAIELALLANFQRHPHGAWLANLTPAEQRLWLSQHLRLEQLEDVQQQQHPTAAQLLQAALHDAGWSGSWNDVEIHIPGTTLDGQRVPDDRIPLLEYCLYRPHEDGILLFSRNGMPLTAEQDQCLRTVLDAPACRTLAARQLAEPAVDEVMQTIVKTRFQRAALEAKGRGALGGNGSTLRGAEIVLAFLAGQSYIEVGELLFDGLGRDGLRLPTGTPSGPFRLPNYLVLRSSAQDPDEQRRGQVVLYRQDLGEVTTFANEQAFSQFINAHRAGQGTMARPSLVEDVIAAAPAQAREVLGKLFTDDTYLGRPPGWAQQNHIVLNFPPNLASGDCFTQWAHASAQQHVAQAARLARQQHQAQVHRWSPAGMRAHRSTQAVTQAQQGVASWQQHVHPKTVKLVNDIHRFLNDDPDAPALVGDSDQILLSYRGHEGSLDYWVTEGWREHGPRQGSRGRFPGADVLKQLNVRVLALDADGAPVEDKDRTTLLNTPVYLSNLCYRLRDLGNSDQPYKGYQGYLRHLPRTGPGRQLRGAMAEALRWRSRALIETASASGGSLNATASAALLSAWAQLNDSPSSLCTVEIDGTPAAGLWALRAAGQHYVLVFNGPAGDQLMDEASFKAFLADDRAAAERFLQPRTELRHHSAMGTALGKARLADGVPISYRAGLTAVMAAQQWLQMLGDDAEFLATRGRWSASEGLKLAAGLAAAAACTVGTAGVAGTLCAAATAGWVVQGFRDGAEALERGELMKALGQMLGAGASGFGMLAPARVARLLFHGGRGSIRTAAEAAEVLLDVASQAVAFDSSGLLIAGLGAAPGVKAALVRRGTDDMQEVLQDGNTFVRTASGDLAQTYIDPHGVRRLVDARNPAAVGPPITQRDGSWRRRDDVPLGWQTRTTPKPLYMPPAVAGNEAFAALPAADRERLMAAFGLQNARTRSSPDLQYCIDHATIKARIGQMIDTPEDMGLPTDMPILIRAWCDSRMGQHKGVRLFTPGARGQADTIGDLIGYRIEGLSVAVPRGKRLPDLKALVDAAGRDTVATRLGLSSAVTDSALMSAVKHELAAVMQRQTAESAASWWRWQERRTVLSPTSDNVYLHYPQLTKAEAESLVHQWPQMAEAGRTWNYGTDHERLAGGMLALRRARQIREGLLQGKANRLDELIELCTHLTAVLPSRVCKVRKNGEWCLEFSPRHGDASPGQLQVGADGKIYRPGSSEACADWQSCVHAQLDAEETAVIGTPAQLQRRVRERMEQTPLTSACDGRRAPAKVRKRRNPADNKEVEAAPKCEPRSGYEPTPTQRDSSKEVIAAHSSSTRTLWQEAATGPHKMTPADLRSLQQANIVSWKIDGLRYQPGEADLESLPINLGSFPTKGQALSGGFDRPGFWNSDAPQERRILQLRYVMLPVTEGQHMPKVREGLYPGSYAFGADGILVEKGTLAAQMTFSKEDLIIKAGPLKGRSITELSAEQLDKLQRVHVSEKLRNLIRKNLLAENVQEWRPGITYGMYEIRSCSEAKFLEGFIRSLAHAMPEGAAMGYPRFDKGRKQLTSVRGEITLYTDKDPCSESCNRRLQELRAWLPNVRLHVQSSFEDGSHRDRERTDWTNKRITQMRENHQHADYTDDMLREKATQEWFRDYQHRREPRTWIGAQD